MKDIKKFIGYTKDMQAYDLYFLTKEEAKKRNPQFVIIEECL